MVSLLFAITVAFAGTPAERLTETAQSLDDSLQTVELNKNSSRYCQTSENRNRRPGKGDLLSEPQAQ